MELRTYYDFADNDYRFLMDLKSYGISANSIGSIAQNTCERYLKHLVNEYVPVTPQNQNEVTAILTTHNLTRLVSYWNSFSKVDISKDVAFKMKLINGFYYSTKYPGDDAETLTELDFRDCFEAVEACKAEVDRIISIMERQTTK